MALTIKWSEKATANFNDILAYLNEHWTNREVTKFIAKTNSTLTVISYQPFAFKASNYKHIRKAVRDTEVYLLSFWDNRMDPKKNKY